MNENRTSDVASLGIGRTMFILACCLPAISHAAEDPSRKCGPGIYCVEEMLCLGKVAGHPPKGMNQDFTVIMLTLRSGKLLHEDTTMSDWLMMEGTPVGNKPGLTIEQAKGLADWTGGQYGPPLRVIGRNVKSGWTTAGFSNGLTLTIASSEDKGDHRFDRLTGAENIEGSTVGDYTLNYECQAIVVDAPSLVITDKK